MLDRYLQDCRRRNLSSNTVDLRRRVLDAFKNESGCSLIDAGTTDIETWLFSRPLAPRSLNAYLSSFASFYKFAARVGLRTDDPSLVIPRPRVPKSLPRPVGDDDLALVLRVAAQPMAAWLALGAFEGLRAFEIAKLCREHVHDWREPPVIVIDQGKGRKDRVLPLHPVALDHLRAVGLPPRGFIFRMENGQPWKPVTISGYVSRFLRGLGIDATHHQFRHWFGSSLYAETKDLRLTQEMMGHEDPRTTAGYAAWSPDEAATAVCALQPKRRLRSASSQPTLPLDMDGAGA